MTQSYTVTSTWSRTEARYVSAKMAADLRQMQQAYGEPSDSDIDDFMTELTVLMTGGYIKEVTYGYHRDGGWVFAMRYVADMNGILVADDNSGRVPRGARTDGARFLSFLSFSKAWSDLTPSQQTAIEQDLPFIRSTGTEPTVPGGGWSPDRTYSSLGNGMKRSTVVVP